jgi:hypothetical protein
VFGSSSAVHGFLSGAGLQFFLPVWLLIGIGIGTFGV